MPMELLWDVASISEGLIARSLFSWSFHGVKVQGTIAFAFCDWSHAKAYFKKNSDNEGNCDGLGSSGYFAYFVFLCR